MARKTPILTIRPIGRTRATDSMPGSLSWRVRRTARMMRRHRWLYVLLIPPLTYYVVFRYIPLFNAQIAFKDFRPILGVLKSPWIGLKHFRTFIQSFYFDQLITNTIIFSGLKLLLGIPSAVVLAVALHETRFVLFRTLVQTVTYLPHFLSWVVMFGILLTILSPANGLLNDLLKSLGLPTIAFLTSPQWFRQIVIGSDIWKETGWSTILYLAALLTVNPELYEAAAVDGASRLGRVRHVSLPSLIPVITLVTLLRLGNILDAGFSQIFVLYSLPVYSVGDILDTWVYRQGILEFEFSLATAVGLFKGAIGLTLILTANRIAKRVAEQSLF